MTEHNLPFPTGIAVQVCFHRTTNLDEFVRALQRVSESANRTGLVNFVKDVPQL